MIGKCQQQVSLNLPVKYFLSSALLILTLTGCGTFGRVSHQAPRAMAAVEGNDLHALSKAIEDFAKRPDVKNFDWFVNSNLLTLLQNNQSLLNLIPSETWSQASDSLSKEEKSVQIINLDFRNSMNLPINFNFRIFSDGIFQDAYFGNNWTNEYQEVTRSQSWLEWDRKTNRLIPHRSLAQVALAERMIQASSTSTIKLFRGLTKPYEINFYKSLNILKSQNLDPSRRALAADYWMRGLTELKAYSSKVAFDQKLLSSGEALARVFQDISMGPQSVLQKAAQFLFEVHSKRPGVSNEWRDSISMSANYEVAKSFGSRVTANGSHSDIITLEMPVSLFKSLATSGEIYVGLEGAPEVALISESAHLLLYEKGLLISE